jgi:hypothetical protein
MIERWIAARFPDLRPLQLRAWELRLAEALEGLSELVRRTTLATIHASANVMQLAFLKLLGAELGRDFLAGFRGSAEPSRGKAWLASRRMIMRTTTQGTTG